jgi:hypothetical protein
VASCKCAKGFLPYSWMVWQFKQVRDVSRKWSNNYSWIIIKWKLLVKGKGTRWLFDIGHDGKYHFGKIVSFFKFFSKLMWWNFGKKLWKIKKSYRMFPFLQRGCLVIKIFFSKNWQILVWSHLASPSPIELVRIYYPF